MLLQKKLRSVNSIRPKYFTRLKTITLRRCYLKVCPGTSSRGVGEVRFGYDTAALLLCLQLTNHEFGPELERALDTGTNSGGQTVLYE